ncbi:hypothetical protein [Oceanobacter kriegii]|uniref:hypothetical protein n=1 Tax=Oceanobacter kriegii TaxID=64972 RepID=UPI0003FC6A68|nr:hypothetical protein [Oceanobacter kriegii]
MMAQRVKQEVCVKQFDQESIVYGVIRHIPNSAELASRYERRSNWAAIQNLPAGVDDDWSLLCREMFSMPGDHVLSGTYQTQIIHFAASYRAVEYEWEAWLRQFESLLKSMYWVSATVHLETELSGKHTFNWQSDQGHIPSDAELRMNCEWEREAGFAI